MSRVDDLFTQYKAEFRAGSKPDAVAYLDRLDGVDRRELEALIDGFLSRAPARAYSAEAFASFREDPRTARIVAGATAAETWPVLLPAARDAARLKRSELVARLAAALGVRGREEKVATYYHRMEQGSLPASGVSDRVLAALGEIVGVSLSRLRLAGERVLPPPPAAPGVAFARRARSLDIDAAGGAVAEQSAPEPWDEVDELFRGG